MNKPAKTAYFLVQHCPKCGNTNIHFVNVFDFKFRVLCLECGHHTAWHINSPQKAVEEWNSQQPENIKT